jgi:tetratricopeptide (TPR) repeat protein
VRMLTCLSVMVAACGALAGELRAQGLPRIPVSPSETNLANSYISPDLEVHVSGENGKPVEGQVIVQLIDVTGKLYEQTPLKSGRARFNQVPKTEFRVLIMAPGYQRAEKRVDLRTGMKLATIEVELLRMTDAEDAASDRGIGALPPKAQKEVGKALQALRTKNTTNAWSHLQAAQREAPNSAEVEYLLGVYASQLNDPVEAQLHWDKALTFNPKQLSSLIELSQSLLNEKKPAEAGPYLNRAVEVEPSSWRAHALLAEADYVQGNRGEAINHAERALELGHEKAAPVQPFLAGMVAEGGDKTRAIEILQDYVNAHRSDAEAVKELEQWKNLRGVPAADHAEGGVELNAIATAVTALPMPSNWFPTDVDEKVPPVESGAVCSLDTILQEAGDQLVTLVHDVDRFTATELVADERIDKWGMPSRPEKRKFTYMVTIEEMRPGQLSVDEYRNVVNSPEEFPNGVMSSGLPALVLIFHPFYAGNYAMTCEGLARINGGLAWQVHFKQRPDKPIAIRGFRAGVRDSTHPAALRGRAWISAENHQILRLETELAQPMPEVRMVAEHIAIEYGTVTFQEGNVSLWLPRSAELYFDWRGMRVHRRLSYENYLLFSVDEKERIGSPKGSKAPNLVSGDKASPLL